MHNLLLGTAKHVFKTWISIELLSKTQLSGIDEKASRFIVPNNVGRLPLNISSNFGGFTASQWRTWTIIYSPIVLKDLLPKQHLRCWLLFVQACKLLTRRILPITDLDAADNLLKLFCKKFQELYGTEKCTPNMHMHLHLKKVFLDFGPAHAFWCFSFERYNGILGSFHTNKKSVELQFMRQFHKKQVLLSVSKDFAELSNFFPACENSTYPEVDDIQFMDLLSHSLPSLDLTKFTYDDENGMHRLLPPLHEMVFEHDDFVDLKNLYQKLHPLYQVEYVSPFFFKASRALLGSDVIGSLVNNHSARASSVVGAFWPSTGRDKSLECLGENIGQVMYYCRNIVIFRDSNGAKTTKHFTLAYVKWILKHSKPRYFGSSATVCINNLFEPTSMFSFIPISRISCRCATTIIDIDDESVYVACPLPINYNL